MPDEKPARQVKLSGALRAHLAELKGAPLAVYTALGLRIGADGWARVDIATLCQETGYSDRETVMQAVADLERRPGVLEVVRCDFEPSQYRPLLYSRNSPESGKTRPAGADCQGAGTRAIQSEYVRLLGYAVTDWAAGEAKAARAIGERYTVGELRAAYEHYKAQPFWSDKRLSLAYLAKNMAEALRHQTNGHGAGGNSFDGVRAALAELHARDKRNGD